LPVSCCTGCKGNPPSLYRSHGKSAASTGRPPALLPRPAHPVDTLVIGMKFFRAMT